MNIELPTIPTGALVLLAFFAPYLVGFLNGALSFIKKPWQKKLVTVIVSIALAAVVLVFYYAMTGEALPDWPAFVILSLLVVSASYALVTKPTATRIEEAVDQSER